MHPSYGISIVGKNCAYYIQIFTVIRMDSDGVTNQSQCSQLDGRWQADLSSMYFYTPTYLIFSQTYTGHICLDMLLSMHYDSIVCDQNILHSVPLSKTATVSRVLTSIKPIQLICWLPKPFSVCLHLLCNSENQNQNQSGVSQTLLNNDTITESNVM